VEPAAIRHLRRRDGGEGGKRHGIRTLGEERVGHERAPNTERKGGKDEQGSREAKRKAPRTEVG